MKKMFIPLAFAMAIVSLGACNSDGSTDTTDTTTVGTQSGSGTEGADGTASGQSRITKESYTDLSTGSKITVEYDKSSARYVNRQTREPIQFFFDPQTHDTFDVSGRLVNMALIRSPQGSYSVDETRIKMQSDGDMKIVNDRTDTKVKLEEDGDTKVKTDDYKEKTDGNDYKYKDDSTKVKLKDGKVSIKTKQ